MKVLFVSSGNSKRGISPIVKAQGDSLENLGIRIDYFTIIGHGLIGYLKNVPRLRRSIKQGKYDLVHAHFSLSGIVATLSGACPLVVSLMGSDVKRSGLWRRVLRFFIKKMWSATIVKSDDMKKSLGLDCVHVIPNGVDLNEFRPLDKYQCRAKLGWNVDKDIVLFAADPSRFEKNYPLAEHSVRGLKDDNVEMRVVHHVDHNTMPEYINASDIVLLTSFWEGSPNVVKEAMACNKKVVTTDVGDVRYLLDGVPGSFIVQSNPESVIHGVMQAIKCEDSSSGRERLMKLGLDSNSVSDRIVRLYQDIICARNHG